MTLSRHPSDTLKTPSRLCQDTRLTLSRHPSDSLKTPSRHSQDILQTLKKHYLNTLKIPPIHSLHLQCDQCRETNIGDRSYERTKLKLKNRALWVAREFHEVFPMMIFVCQVFRLCEKMAIARSHCIGSIWCIK